MPTLAADMLSFENEPTAVLHELGASAMALPILHEPHVMQLRTPAAAKLRSPGDLTSLASPTISLASPRTSVASPMSSDAGSPGPEAPAKRVRLRQKTAAPPVNEERSALGVGFWRLVLWAELWSPSGVDPLVGLRPLPA